MAMQETPFNVSLLQVPDNVRQMVQPVTSLSIYDGASKNFHPEGLYSAAIFGAVGTSMRFEKFSYINLGMPVMHPLVYRTLMTMKGFYSEIMSGKEYAVWDAQAKDFVRSDASAGQTGYFFFMSKWKSIDFNRTPSSKRDEKIKFLNAFKANSDVQYLYVIPAGLRDITIDANGREKKDECNDLYYKLIAISNTVSASIYKASPEVYDAQRVSYQNTVNQLFDMFMTIVSGKNGLYMGKWMARKVFDSTRNVITAMPTSASHIGDPSVPTVNDTAVGIYQYVKSVVALCCYQLRNKFLNDVFFSPSAPARLVNKKTMRSVMVDAGADAHDRWMTDEGLERMFNAFEDASVRHQAVEIAGHYLGLVYRGPDNSFRLIHGIDDLPEGRQKEHCTPITYTELLYCCLYQDSKNHCALVTRYPIASDRSTFPSNIFLMSTVKFETRTELGEDWRPLGNDAVAHRFPVIGSETFNSQSSHPCKLAKLGADHDGDMMSFTPVYTRESVAEIRNKFKKKEFYLSPNGGFNNHLTTDTIGYVLTVLGARAR
jgi:hypothetical protein